MTVWQNSLYPYRFFSDSVVFPFLIVSQRDDDVPTCLGWGLAHKQKHADTPS